ncbi:MAG TPA: prolipoprotein diacylglyceryl transferase family protein [Actinomycetota bacterium]
MDALLVVAAVGWKVLDRFRLGPLAISPHGLGIAIGFLAGAYVFLYEARKRGLDEQRVSNVPFWALIGTLIGTRLGYVLTHLSDFHSLLDVIAVWRGGISLLGGIVGAIAVCYPLLRRNGVRFLVAMDSAAIGIPLGVVIGRIGDLIIGDHLGKPTSWLLAFRYHGGVLSGYQCVAGECSTALAGGKAQIISSQGARLLGPDQSVLAGGLGVHQTALYDLIATMALIALLDFINRVPRRVGVLTLTFATWYATGRILSDFLRVENRFFGLTGSQWTSIAAVVISLATLVWFRFHPDEPEPSDAAEVEETELAG